VDPRRSRIEASTTIAHPPARVFAALRDRLEALARLVDQIESVEVLAREQQGELLYQHNRWQGVKDSVPAAFRRLAPRDLFGWFDHAEWHEPSLCCRWRVEPLRAKHLFDCRGTTTVADDGQGGSRFTLRGELELHLERIPGLPAFIGRRINGIAARFVANAMRPNLLAMASAVRDYLDHGGT
jgi:hypothetical protein